MRELDAELGAVRRPDPTPIAPVLCYHAIDVRPSPAMAPYATTPALLARHVTLLREHGYELVTLSRLADELRAGLPRAVASITFDDALGSFADVALPVLQGLDVPVTLYVPTAWVGTRAGWMDAPERIVSWDELRELDAAGVEIGAHGHRHRELDVGPGAVEDIRTSKRVLEDELQHAVRSFAYPFGAHDRRIRDEVEAAGFESAAAVKDAWTHGGSDPYAIARLLVRPSHDGVWLDARLRRRRPLDPVRERVRTTVRRHWRRRRARPDRVHP
jgi:peptidoglycan/xylan/chitin deacetylase (PgdA/CDA1 family)